LISVPAWAANHYIRAGATGANNGSDWTNAFNDLPTALIRGDIYYVADGNYCPNGYSFDDAVDGEKYIKVLKATVSAHGNDVGWNNSYGDGQAVFTETIDIRTSYIVFDGIMGGSPVNGTIFPDTTAYGFSVVPKNTHGVDHNLIVAPHSRDIDYIQISHCLLVNLGYNWDAGVPGQICIYVGGDYATDHYLISHNYMANASTLLILYQSSNTVVENNYFMSNWSSPQNHGQLVAPGWNSDDVIFRNNVFYHPAVFVFGAHILGSERWQVYNNIVIGDGSPINAGFANAQSAYPDIILNSDFHHNVFYDFDFGRGAVFVGKVSDDLFDSGKSRVYNNIFYKVKDVDLSGDGYTPGIIIHDYNDYYDCSGRMPLGTNDKVYSGIDPFVDSAKFDFRLKGPTQPGKVLPPPYDIDHAGIVRGTDGNWDKGVFEYVDEQQQTLALTSGWNWISFNVLSADLSLNSIFSSILGQVEQVKAQTQSALRSNDTWKGDLADMSGIGQYKMYKVKASANCILTVTGTTITSVTPIPLAGGWNWVAFLPTTAMPIATALDSIKGQILEVKSLTQSATYSGGVWSGSLTQLEPGQGYAIRMSGSGTLTYLGGQ
jgi:hypothetical protein